MNLPAPSKSLSGKKRASLPIEVDGEKSLILDDRAIRSKISRIAYQIYERNFGEKKIVLAGIDVRGGYVADELAARLRDISELRIVTIRAEREINTSSVSIRKEDEKHIKGSILIVVDDVLYSGLTVFNAIAAVIPFKPLKVQSAVLIDRGHRNLPVRPDFVGLKLATTLKQHVSVEVSKSGEKVRAFLQ